MSVDLSWTTDEADGVRFVACRVHNGADLPRRVRIDSRLSGPVFPPRRSGVPEVGWDRGGVTLRLDPGEHRGIGFASPAPVGVETSDPLPDPPVVIAGHEPRLDDDADPRQDASAAAVRMLDEHRPPSDAVADAMVERDRTTTDVETLQGGTVVSDVIEADTRSDVNGGTGPVSDSTIDPTTVGPDRIDDWFGAVERRIERVERLTSADLDAATEVVDAAGGIDAVADLDRRTSADAESLRRLSERAVSLAKRAESVDAPIETLERLA